MNGSSLESQDIYHLFGRYLCARRRSVLAFSLVSSSATRIISGIRIFQNLES